MSYINSQNSICIFHWTCFVHTLLDIFLYIRCLFAAIKYLFILSFMLPVCKNIINLKTLIDIYQEEN